MPEPSWREFAPEPWDEKEGSYGWNYSTVKSAQRLSATLSMRPRRRVQIIDI